MVGPISTYALIDAEPAAVIPVPVSFDAMVIVNVSAAAVITSKV